MRQLDLRDQENAPVLRSYLQLVLALSSREKQQKGSTGVEDSRLDGIVNFQSVLEDHFIENREVAFFAEKFGVSVNDFSKKISKYFGKPPSKLIQERMVMEEKQLLHLTHNPVTEIEDQLNFNEKEKN